MRRQKHEPLVEIFQVKGGSECRFDRIANAGLDTVDELCTFEQLPTAGGAGAVPVPLDQYPRRTLVRNVLKDGLALEQRLGANPFKMGLIGSTDTHNGAAGSTEEVDWQGPAATRGNDSTTISSTIYQNPGGLAVVWAEENSRDAIFDEGPRDIHSARQ